MLETQPIRGLPGRLLHVVKALYGRNGELSATMDTVTPRPIGLNLSIKNNVVCSLVQDDVPCARW